jgi:choline dehydrogenase-like flavoprotein
MGADPTTSVTDADGRTHDHPNLFLAGAGLFPTTGTGNPTLTLAALALRTSATIAADLGVAAATPVASPTS